jgi:hypothetical protein
MRVPDSHPEDRRRSSVILFQGPPQRGPQKIFTLTAGSETAGNRTELPQHLILDETIATSTDTELLEGALGQLSKQVTRLDIEYVERRRMHW